jgi:hypothetical protein
VFPPPYRTLEDRSLLISRIHPGLTLRLGLKEEEREIEELRDGVAFMELDPGGGFLLIRAPGEVESMGYAEALRLCATVMGSNKARQTVAQSVAAA